METRNPKLVLGEPAEGHSMQSLASPPPSHQGHQQQGGLRGDPAKRTLRTCDEIEPCILGHSKVIMENPGNPSQLRTQLVIR